MSALFDAVNLHAYWSSAGLTEWNALRWRLFRRPSVPIYVGECGRDRVRDGPNGTYLPTGPGPYGWQHQNITGTTYWAELNAYDAECRADGVFGTVFTTSPDDLWAASGFSVDDLCDQFNFTNLGPHDLEGRSPQALVWAARAPIVKSVDQTAAIRRARSDAITVYRRRFSPAEQDDILARTDAAHLVGAIIEGLAGFRHPRLFVELLNEVGKGQRLQYEALAQVVVPQLRAAGLKVAGPSWATGDYEEIDWATFALGGAPAVPDDIVLSVPMRTSLAAPENYSPGPRARTIGVVIHTTRGGASTVEREYIATINWFQNPAAQASAHLVVGAGSFAEVCRSVHDDDVAWHCREANATHLGIEIAQTEPSSPITDFQYVAAADAVKKWAAKYHFPLARVMSQTVPGLVGHEDTEAGKRDGKTDPGRMFDWDRFMRLVTGGTPVPPTDPAPALRDKTWALADQLQKLGADWRSAGYPHHASYVENQGEAIKDTVAISKSEK